jgi:hypothetical protein
VSPLILTVIKIQGTPRIILPAFTGAGVIAPISWQTLGFASFSDPEF